MELVKAVVGPGSVRDMVRAIDLATSAYVSEGITSFTEAGVGCPGVDHSPIELAAWQTARREQRLHARAQLMVYSELLHALPGHETDEAKLGLDLGVHTGFGDGWLRLGAMKLWIDGAGTAGQAATSTPSGKATDSDPDADSGFVDDPRRMSGMIIAAHRAGWQVAAHAMGDRAVDLLLAALEQAGPEAEVRGRRHRIEHAGLVRPDQIERIRRLGVVVAIQPPFITEFGDTLAQHFGADRVSWSIRCRSLTEAGVVVAASSDRPVAPGPPLQGVQTMVERLTASGALYGEHERVTATEALRAYTWSGAFAAHSEGDVGKVTARNLADLVVLEDDPTTVDPSDIAGIQIVATVVDGRAVHDPGRLFPAHRSDDDDRA
jgi:predicted amidohydrolase YtcJ